MVGEGNVDEMVQLFAPGIGVLVGSLLGIECIELVEDVVHLNF